jgi:hypothetical protein
MKYVTAGNVRAAARLSQRKDNLAGGVTRARGVDAVIGMVHGLGNSLWD